MEDHNKTQHTEHKSEPMPDIGKVDLKSVSPDALKGGFGDVIEILKMNQAKMDAVAARDGEGITLALVYLVIGQLVAALGGAVLGYTILGTTFRTPIVNALIGGVVSAAISAAVLYITSLIAVRVFNGKGKFPAYFRVMGYASLINVVGFVTMVPFLTAISGIWLLVINYKALMSVHKLDSTNAILSIVLTVVAFFVLTYLVGMIGLNAMMAGGAGAMNYSAV